MSILKKLLHKCSYQLGGKKANTTITSPILPPLLKTDKPEDYKPETYTKMKPLVKGNIGKGFIVPIPNAKPSNGEPLFVPLPNASPDKKLGIRRLPKLYDEGELPIIYGQLMNVKDYDERIARIANTPIKASPKSTTPILGNESDIDTPKKKITIPNATDKIPVRVSDVPRIEPKSYNSTNTDLNSRVKRLDFQDYMPKDNVAMTQKIDNKRNTNVPLTVEEKLYYNMSGVGEFFPDLIEDENERNILTQEAIKRGIPIKNNNSLKPATQYKRVKSKEKR